MLGNAVFWTWHGRFIRKLAVAVVPCPRTTQEQNGQRAIMHGGATREVRTFPKGLGAINGCWGRSIIFFSSVDTDKFHVVNNTPCPPPLMLMQAVLIKPNESKKKSHVVLGGRGMSESNAGWKWQIYFNDIWNYQQNQQNSESWWLNKKKEQWVWEPKREKERKEQLRMG